MPQKSAYTAKQSHKNRTQQCEQQSMAISIISAIEIWDIWGQSLQPSSSLRKTSSILFNLAFGFKRTKLQLK